MHEMHDTAYDTSIVASLRLQRACARIQPTMHTCVGSSLAQDADNSPTCDGRSNREVGDLPIWETGVGQIFNLSAKKVEDVDLQLREISVG
jgi:hypothetical protein